MNVHFSSKTPEWATPQDVFDKLNIEFRFTLDPAATKKNAKCKRFYTTKENGLKQPWKDERVFVNPPYGRVIGAWVEKMATGGGFGVCRTASCAYRHSMVSRLHSRKGRDTLLERPSQVWRKQIICAISEHDLCLG